jgi:8-amino-7-oxononanoate synthase
MRAGPRRMSADQRAELITGMQQNSPVAAPSRMREDRTVVATAAADFDDLPGYAAIRMQQAFAAKLGVGNPFYRSHATRAGVQTELDGVRRTNFTSYDYLGLNGHPEIVSAVAEAAERWGTSVSASRLTSGERPFHAEFETAIAGLYNAEAALTFVSGHATNLAVIGCIVEPGDLVVHDALAHNSIILGAEISGAHRRSFAHNDLDALDALLAGQRGQFRRCLIVTEGLFSMDGDGPELGRLIEVKRRHGAWLMIDDAHALGVLGRTGRGLAEHAGIDPAEVDIWMGTLSKTLVSCGGYVAGPAALVDFLKYSAPGMVYSVGIPPTATIAAMTALDLMLRQPERIAALQANGRRFLATVRAAGLDTGTSWGAAVAPVLIGDSLQTVLLTERLIERGFVAVPVIPPGVPEKLARLRFFLSASHTAADIDAAIAALVKARLELDATGITLASVAGDALPQRTAGILGA